MFAEQMDARNVGSDPNGFSHAGEDAIPKNADDALRAMASNDLGNVEGRLPTDRGFDEWYVVWKSVITKAMLVGRTP